MPGVAAEVQTGLSDFKRWKEAIFQHFSVVLQQPTSTFTSVFDNLRIFWYKVVKCNSKLKHKYNLQTCFSTFKEKNYSIQVKKKPPITQ